MKFFPESIAKMVTPLTRHIAWSILVGAAIFVFLYQGYPFDGMIIEESWNLYTYKGDALRSTQNAQLWPWLFMRRGVFNLTLLLMDSVGSTPLLVNVLCIGIQAVNLALFAFIVWKLAGPARLFPILMVALLYPFASSAHFWQIGLLHLLAVMFFLIALALFLRVSWSHECRVRDLLLYGLPSLGCFWLSIGLMEYAILLPVLFLYLALYNSNGRSVLLKFNRFSSPAISFALCYLALSLVFIGLVLSEGHGRLPFLSSTNTARFGEWASWTHVPPVVVAGLVMGVNAMLFFSTAILANSIGYLGYPLMAVIDHASVLIGEAKYWGVGVGLVSLLGSYGFYAVRSRPDNVADRKAVSPSFLVTIGLLWAFLAYLPMSSSFAYARVIGHTADRVNALALFGVSLGIGSVVARLTSAVIWDRPRRTAIAFAGCFLTICVLLLNLYIQREYWIEGYQKELKIVMEVLNGVGQEQMNGRKPLVFLDRDKKIERARSRLNRALQEPSASAKLFNVAKVVLARHFTEAGEMEIMSYHLQGIPLFGGLPDCSWVFNNYARQFSRNPVVVYRTEDGTALKEDADDLVLIGYSYEIGSEIRYSKREYKPIVLSLDESFFQFRGAANYRVRQGVMETAVH